MTTTFDVVQAGGRGMAPAGVLSAIAARRTLNPGVVTIEPGDAPAAVPTWPLWLVGLLDVASAAAYQAGVPWQSWWFATTWLLTLLALMWHSRRARRLGHQRPATSPLDTWDGGGMGGGLGT